MPDGAEVVIQHDSWVIYEISIKKETATHKDLSDTVMMVEVTANPLRELVKDAIDKVRLSIAVQSTNFFLSVFLSLLSRLLNFDGSILYSLVIINLN